MDDDDDDVLLGGGGLDCKLRGVSGMVADSIMMGIVNSAMEQAFDKACSKEGVMEQLNHKSRFCELAVLQLDWCLKFVQQQTHDNFFLIEQQPCFQRQKLVSDLTETRDRIQGHLLETEVAIWNKDRHFSETPYPQFSLPQTPPRRNLNNPNTTDGDFCELKNSVDQQFFHIKQKLEGERINLASEIRKMSQDNLQLAIQEGSDRESQIQASMDCCEFDSPNHSHSLNTGFDMMGSDIDALKETFDFAFGMMSNAISLAEVGPMEQQWRWVIEKDTLIAVFKGFLWEIQQGLKPKLSKMRNGSTCGPNQLSLGDNWSHLMNEIAILRYELDQLVSPNEDRAKTVATRESVTSPPPIKNMGDNAATCEDVCYTLDRSGKSENTTPNAEGQDHLEDASKDQNAAGQGSLVAEMIRNHESIIRQKSEELNWLKGEILREKGNLTAKRDKGRDTMRKRIRDLISRLDSIINRNINLVSLRGVSTQEARQQEEEQEDSNLKTVITDDIYVFVLRNLLKDLHFSLHNDDILRTLREDICQVFFRELHKEWKQKVASYINESHTREKMYCFICKDAHGGYSLEDRLVGKYEDNMDSAPSHQFKSSESPTRKDVQAIIPREMLCECRFILERSNIENHIREEVVQTALHDAEEDIDCTHSSTPTKDKLRENSACDNTQIEKLECKIQADVYMAFFREMAQEWKKETDSYDIEPFVQSKGNSQKVLPSNDILCKLQSGQYSNLMQTLESLSNCFEVEENLILSTSLEFVRLNAHIQPFDLKHDKEYEDEEVHRKGTLITKDEAFASVINKLEMVMQHIFMSRVQLKKLRSYLDLAVGDLNGGCDQMLMTSTSVNVDPEDSMESHYLSNKKKEAEKNPFIHLLTTFTIFLKAVADFECRVHGKIRFNVSRLEELKHQLDFCAEHASSITKEKSIYRKAFLKRCCNLQKAEAEVELLADELDDVLILLEKIYIALDHYSPILQHYFGIKDILKLIREKLKRSAADTIL